MDFQPTEIQQMLAHSVERLLQDNWDFNTRQKHLHAGKDSGLWPEFAAMGLQGVEIGEEFGGSGGSFADLASALIPMGKALVTDPFVATVVLSAALLAREGSPDQQRAWLPRIATGECKASLAHTERRARDMVSWVETRAVRDGQGWRLDGAKAVVAGGDAADVFLISARTSGEAGSPQGISLFVVPRKTKGLNIRSYPLYDGSGGADLQLDGVVLPAEALLGVADQAHAALAEAWDRGAAAVCVEAVGTMGALHDLTLDYLKTRVQFGQPIGHFQALQHRMADVHMALELSRSMAMLAISAIEENDPSTRASQISAAKVFIGRACREVGQSCVQLSGGIAITNEYPAGHYFKRLTMIERLFGDVDHHLARYAGLPS